MNICNAPAPKYALCVWVFLLAFAAQAQQNLSLIKTKAHLFDQKYLPYDSRNFITGSILYKENIPDMEDGYLPENIISVEASSLVLIYDFTKEVSPLMLNNELQADLKEKGYEILFACSRENCGDVQGWNLYLSSSILGDIKKQHYFIARRMVNDSEAWYVAFYVNDISGVPRGVLAISTTKPITLDIFTINKELQLADSSNSSSFFLPNSAIISPAMTRELDEWGNWLVNNPDAEISLNGYSDSTGTDSYNLKLSKLRAESVKKYLVNKYGINPDRLLTEGKGKSSEVPDNSARRVDLVKNRD